MRKQATAKANGVSPLRRMMKRRSFGRDDDFFQVFRQSQKRGGFELLGDWI
jgi:hypothetical protein